VRDPLPPANCHIVTQNGVAADADTQISISCVPGDDGAPVTYAIDAPPAHGTLTRYGQEADALFVFIGGIRPVQFTASWPGCAPGTPRAQPEALSATLVRTPTHGGSVCVATSVRPACL
jgi:hypothetical protein